VIEHALPKAAKKLMQRINFLIGTLNFISFVSKYTTQNRLIRQIIPEIGSEVEIIILVSSSTTARQVTLELFDSQLQVFWHRQLHMHP